eukprot:CAMPEP_0178957040 /NCGR_PEP_ID=MMETSP0789-20121207/10657_1 /TAXON_ID=3005 /ORGANISM="Rhizosolenia setigera, Strain CCMP 1694" /LENGTH=214 /DNA_ID=CAMNT_0020639173 /DNA_START=73 /DNA_END=717 /DNA_ORIENTATION=+
MLSSSSLYHAKKIALSSMTTKTTSRAALVCVRDALSCCVSTSTSATNNQSIVQKNQNQLQKTAPAKGHIHNNCRFFHNTPIQLMGLEEFRDTTSRSERMEKLVGREWTVKELRRKSYDDLHKLWYVLYKEKNMLMTETKLSKRNGIVMPQPERRTKVKRGMNAIKVVLGERKREAIEKFQEKKDMEALEMASDLDGIDLDKDVFGEEKELTSKK